MSLPLARLVEFGLFQTQAASCSEPLCVCRLFREFRTMIDALVPALEALPCGIEAAAHAARQGADYTATISKAKAGRASYISGNKLTGHIDPGAEAVARLFEQLLEPVSC